MRDFHAEPFDEATQVKLRLFGHYVREWLPVFIYAQPRPDRITIVDFFAGPGRDADGRPGSPLIVSTEIRGYEDDIQEQGAEVRLELNEAMSAKAHSLAETLRSELGKDDPFTYRISSEDFEDAFEKLLPTLRSGPNLLLLDQQGVKFITDAVFSQLIDLPRTDFIFFIASSTLRRFATHPSIRRHIDLPGGAVSARAFNDTHRVVVDYYQALADRAPKDVFLGSFSIKKGSNIYGLIFASSHPLGMEKFLRVCWQVDPERGEANFDIDDDRIDSDRPALFPEMDIPKKTQVFERQLEKRILSGELRSDRSVYLATLRAGFLPKDGRGVLKKLIRNNLIRCSGQPRVSQAGYKDPRQLEMTHG